MHHGRAPWVHRADLVILGQARCRASRGPRTVFPCMPEVSDTVPDTLSFLDVHFVNPSPVFLLDKAGDCRHLETILRAVLPDPQTRMAPMPAPYAPPVTCAAEEQAQLEALTRAHATPQALACRCRLLLRAAAPEHPSNLRLATEMHCDRHTVRLWRTRYLAQGLEGLQDAPRSGRPRRFAPR